MIKQRILHVAEDSVLVLSSRTQKSYPCKISKDFDVKSCQKGDTALIQWESSNPYIVDVIQRGERNGNRS